MTANAALSTPKFTMSDAEFDHVRQVIRDLTGITMGDTKRQLVTRRLTNRLKDLGIQTLPEYLEFLASGDPGEVEKFTNAVTTNLTSFFRESHHFDFLKSTAIPEIISAGGSGPQRLRIWSAGCSTGEEPYSIAMCLSEMTRELVNWDTKILATDLDSDVVATAKAGIYSQNRFENLAKSKWNRWFSEAPQGFSARQPLRQLITFKQLNLMHDWPMRGKFDVIFCRNVVIYFDKPTQRILMDRYAEILKPGGYLFLGHSESLFNVSDRFSLIGKTIYRKKDG